ncbi:ATP-grasp domain-containing protein [Micromonospora maritima]|uniref:ATP-grasp domain-containing protein n=1 Tax=Micromonospora maritima TaxID=986711 RepID=UPI0037A59A21
MAGPADIVQAATGVCEVVFLCDFSLPEVERQRRVLEALGTVMDMTGMAATDVAVKLTGRGVRHLLTFSEPQLTRTAEVAEAAGISFLSREVAERCTNKSTQRAVLAAAGLQHVRHRVLEASDRIDEALEDVGLPAVVKPIVGVGSRDVAALHTNESATTLLRDMLSPSSDAPPVRLLLEEMLEGDESGAGAGWGDYVSVEALLFQGEVVPVSVTGKFPLVPPFRESGIIVPATVSASLAQECVALATAAVRALDIRCGVTHTELKLTKDGPRIIEVNGRLGGYVPELLSRATGFDLVKAALLLAIGRPVSVPPLHYDTVEFEYFIQPPVDAQKVVDISGWRELRQLPGVRRVEQHARAGDAIDWRKGTLTHLAVVHASARDHAQAREMAALISDTLQVTYG